MIDDRQHLESLRQAHLKRLRVLEIKEAQQGQNTPAEIVIELEEIRHRISDIESRLANLSTPVENVETIHKAYQEISKILTTRFNKPELKELCFYLNIDIHELEGERKSEKANSLLVYLHQHNRLIDLIRVINNIRPDIQWEDVSNESCLTLISAAKADKAPYVYKDNRLIMFYEQMRNKMNLDKIRDLCFELNIDFEELTGETKFEKIIDLIIYIRNSNKFSELIECGKKYHPYISWQAINDQHS